MIYKNRFLIILLIVLFVVLLTNWEKHVAPLYKEIQIDSLYVDFNNEIYYHIKYFRNTEDCVKKVIRFADSSEYRKCWFVTNKRGCRIEDGVVFVNRKKTDHFLLAKCDTLSHIYSSLIFEMSKPKPVRMEKTEKTQRGDSTYIKGNFVTLNFDVLESFIESVPAPVMRFNTPHTYILLNTQNEKKLSLMCLVI